MLASNIIGAPFEVAAHHPPPLASEGAIHFLDGNDRRGRPFCIRAADTDGHRSAANVLVGRRYAWRGYHGSFAATHTQGTQDRVTLLANHHDQTIGTITLGFDGEEGLFADAQFAPEIDGLRRDGLRISEFTKLAVDTMAESKLVLASLFHVAYIYARRLKAFDCVLIEVNPRHVRFYERMLGFKIAGRERMNHRVHAPAVLMCLDFEHTQAQIDRFGGRPECASFERSLYPYAFSAKEEAGILRRLREEASCRATRPAFDEAIAA